MKTLSIVIHGGIFVLWIDFIFPVLWKQNQLGDGQSLARGITGEQEHWEQTQVCLDAPNALALVPGGQRHTPDVSVLRSGSRPVCVFSYLSVWAQLTLVPSDGTVIQGGRHLGKVLPCLELTLKFCKGDQDQHRQDCLNDDCLCACEMACWHDWCSRKTRHYIHWGKGGEMQVPVFASTVRGSLSLSWILGFSLARVLKPEWNFRQLEARKAWLFYIWLETCRPTPSDQTHRTQAPKGKPVCPCHAPIR